MARPYRTECRTDKGDWDSPTVREGILPERPQPGARSRWLRRLRRRSERWCRFCARFERTKAGRGGSPAESGLFGGSAGLAKLAHVTRVTALGELTASIAHEISQPLAAVVANAHASLRWLSGDSPDLARSP